MISLKERYKDYFKVGAAVNNRTIKSNSNLITKHFNSITCENEMKASSIAIGKDQYDFMAADEIVDFAMKNDLLVRGHTFVWHNQTLDWFFEGMDRKQLLERIKNHITIVGNRYREQVFCWDVVNEAIEDKADTVLRRTKWVDILGERFMDDVFRITKEILPEKKLFYNDYNETNPAKRVKIYNTIKAMKDRGVPVDGIGMQCHSSIYGPSADELKETIELYASLGVQIHITELDVSLFEFGDHSRIEKPDAKLLDKQAKIYEDYFKIFREYKEVIECVTLWGVADDYTWLDNFPVRNRKNWPLLFDEENNPKEAFYRITDF